MGRVLWVVLGVVIGLSLAMLRDPKKPISTAASKDWAQAGIDTISKEADPAKQLQAAEEYYGKAVVLFLASVVNRMQPPATVAVENRANLAEPIIKEIPAEKNSFRENDTESRPRSVEQSSKNTVSQIRDGIDQKIAFMRAPLINRMTPEVKKVLGHFVGTFTHERGDFKGRIDKIEMDLNFEVINDALQGNVLILLSDPDGNVYSRSSGDGDNQTLRLVKDKKDQIYVQTAPGEFIIMDLRDPQRLTGRYINSAGLDRGQVILWKK